MLLSDVGTDCTVVLSVAQMTASRTLQFLKMFSIAVEYWNELESSFARFTDLSAVQPEHILVINFTCDVSHVDRSSDVMYAKLLKA